MLTFTFNSVNIVSFQQFELLKKRFNSIKLIQIL